MSAQVLIDLLQEELNCLECLWQTLQDEHLALRQREVTDMETAVNKKQNVMMRLEVAFQAHEERLRISGLPSTPEGIGAYVRASASQGEEQLSALWEQRQERLQ